MNFMLMLILSILFAALCFVIVYQGVEEGIEKYSKILMPILLIIVVFIAIYSLSIAMGIMITYGSYMKKNANLVKSVNQIELFDTGIALLAGMMDKYKWTRKKSTLIMAATTFVISILVCLGYNVFYFELKFPNNTIKKGSQYNGCPFFCV